jgi:hypothetical protein
LISPPASAISRYRRSASPRGDREEKRATRVNETTGQRQIEQETLDFNAPDRRASENLIVAID